MVDEYERLYTQLAKNGFPNMNFADRHIIHSNSRIQGGVMYYSGVPMEACVVDFDKDDFLKTLYDEVLKINRERAGIKDVESVDKKYILQDVFELVESRIPYDFEEYTSGVPKELIGQKITVGWYIEKRGFKGVCRHQALVAGAIIEKMCDEGMLSGKVRVRTNVRVGKEGHAWVEYTNSANEKGVLDVAQHYFGPRDDAKNWNYKV